MRDEWKIQATWIDLQGGYWAVDAYGPHALSTSGCDLRSCLQECVEWVVGHEETDRVLALRRQVAELELDNARLCSALATIEASMV